MLIIENLAGATFTCRAPSRPACPLPGQSFTGRAFFIVFKGKNIKLRQSRLRGPNKNDPSPQKRKGPFVKSARHSYHTYIEMIFW
ncbi:MULTISPECIES: hypothetical protein [unclassified Brucella]|uniref:hypothetical protein n=1 Tax=unclassified Brucella TaxID=2632610 RepID=UPI000972A6A4|nr:MULTISPECIES: hypothetical protein [unclassified Brucella]APX68686.1 hypothetical protein BKD03_04580 [Brucella sp. 09RB8471]MRN42463.1 hypothetical protein [Brucella sp. 09RB8913]MRN57575.1 hypothetical protein [Brucella sp. 09RB8918]MRN79118.1 hypothetical protein [Brucella sp. 10RB9210]